METIPVAARFGAAFLQRIKKEHLMVRKILLATAGLAIASPALAEGPYVGLEGGILFPQHMRGTFTSTYSQTAQTPAAGTAAAAPGTGVVGTLPTAFTTIPATTTGGAEARFKQGLDIDAILGYSFGMFRLEGELGWKRSNVKSFSQDTAFGTSVTSFLNPTGATTTTPFVFPNGNLNSFNLGNDVNVWSGMINGLLSFGDPTGVNFYVGPGIGRARVKSFGISDSAWAYQGIAGINYGLGGGLNIGLKYRYFRTGKLDFVPTAATFTTASTVAVPNVPAAAGGAASGSTNVAFTRSANVNGAFNDHFSSHSLLLSLSYNFGGAAEAAPLPPPPPPPPPPAAPATQTCPDGSVIDATATCPVPPPPPPPPPPAQRGERG
jgi:opacity protein-like surface antigen